MINESEGKKKKGVSKTSVMKLSQLCAKSEAKAGMAFLFFLYRGNHRVQRPGDGKLFSEVVVISDAISIIVFLFIAVWEP